MARPWGPGHEARDPEAHTRLHRGLLDGARSAWRGLLHPRARALQPARLGPARRQQPLHAERRAPDRPGHAGETAADLRQTFKRFDPTNRNLALITGELATRRQNIRHVVHNFRLITDALNSTDGTLGRFVESSNANFQAFANQDQNL